jgi:hypothetical protein
MTNSAAKNESGASAPQIDKSAVHATFNYLADMEMRPVYYNDDHQGGNLRFDSREIELVDASSLSQPPRLDVEGFQLLPHVTSQRNLAEAPSSAAEPYAMELEALLRDALSADHVCVNRRQITRHQRYDQDGYKAQPLQGPPAAFIHSDTSIAHGPTYVMAQGKPEEGRTVRRMAMLNQWRLVSPPPTNLPLALLDARTVAPEDLVLADSTVKDRSICLEMYLLRYNPAHKWYYFSQQGYDDLLVFKQFDSDPNYPCFVPHSAFFNSTVRNDAPPRINYETRAAAFWYAD